MKRFLGIFIIILLCVVAGSANASSYKYLDITTAKPTTLEVGEQIQLNTTKNQYFYTLSDNTVCTLSSSNVLTATSEGETVLYKVYRRTSEVISRYLISVVSDSDYLNIDGPTKLAVNDTCLYTASSNKLLEVVFSSSDPDVIQIDEEGNAIAISEGMARVCVKTKTEPVLTSEMYVIVNKAETFTYKDETINVDMSNIDSVFSNLAKDTAASIVIVTSYFQNKNKLSQYDKGCGIIYKRVAHLKDGTTQEGTVSNFDDVQYYDYYLVTNKHIVAQTTYSTLQQKSNTTSCDKVDLYYGSDERIDANIIAYDSKVDIAVLSFTSTRFFSTATFGDSTKVKPGEIIISIGTSEGEDYFTTTTFGIVSSEQRWIDDDTDGDGTNDWNAKYIQHDAAINTCDCGSPIINLKGEIIGLNTAKKIISSSGVKVENNSFAIPTELIESLIPILETGEVPQRPTIGVTVISVIDIIPNRAYYEAAGYVIPDGYDYGFLVESVTPYGIAFIAGVKAGDLILTFNGEKLTYMYLMRQFLDHYIVGSGQTAELKILRNGQVMYLTLTF